MKGKSRYENARRVLGGLFGVTLMLWICIQFYMFPLNFMSTIFFVFALAAPVRAFCTQAAGQIREADYILVHHQNSVYENAAREMDRLLGLSHTGLRSVRCRTGAYRTVSSR